MPCGSLFGRFCVWIHGTPCASMETHGNPCRSTRSTLQNLICYRMSVSRASGTPCGSVFGRFCVSRFVKLEQLCGKISWKLWKTMAGKWKMDPNLTSILDARPPPPFQCWACPPKMYSPTAGSTLYVGNGEPGTIEVKFRSGLYELCTMSQVIWPIDPGRIG